MKTLLNYSIILVFMIGLTLVSCNKQDVGEESTLTQVITLPTGDEISVDDTFVHQEEDGIDTTVGTLTSEDLDMEIIYDIGYLAGEIVDATSSTCDMAVNSTFCWRSDTTFIYATFSDLGPANFICKLGNDELFLDIMKTVEDK